MLQPVTKYTEATTFWKRFPLFRFDQGWWVCRLHWDYASDKLLTHIIDIWELEGVLMDLSLILFRKILNKLCFIKLSQNFCDWLSESAKKVFKRKTRNHALFSQNVFFCRFYQVKLGILTFQPTQTIKICY